MGRPCIFISAVSAELAGARRTVARVLGTLGYDPVSEEEAATLASGVARTLRDMTIGGIIGNRTDAGVIWIAKKAWPELEPIINLINEIIEETGIPSF